MSDRYDKIIIGGGIYGLYSALHCGRKGEKILVLEYDSAPFQRATYINQARVHQGYHYPRSISTAMKSAGYFERFCKDFDFCIHTEFEKIYGISKEYTWTNGEQFKHFCKAAGIPCEEICPEKFFQKGMCDGAFITKEYTYDARILKEWFLEQIAKLRNVTITYDVRIQRIEKLQDMYAVYVLGKEYHTDFLLNATYASVNQILQMLSLEGFHIKYELCEIILCETNAKLKDYGITVMDGPFFSIMPFGKTGVHSLTSVTFTPHKVCYQKLPDFLCQTESDGYCSSRQLGNCNRCEKKPVSAYAYMERLARKYLRDEYQFQYKESLFSVKPILVSTEIDDARPTEIKVYSKAPTLVSVLSGKINTIYDLDEVLDNEM